MLPQSILTRLYSTLLIKVEFIWYELIDKVNGVGIVFASSDCLYVS